MLLTAGAEIDATANVYGGGCTTLGLAATSVHPERAGVQEALLQTLLDHGASLEQPSLAGNRESLVIACLANGRPKAAEFLASAAHTSTWPEPPHSAGSNSSRVFSKAPAERSPQVTTEDAFYAC